MPVIPQEVYTFTIKQSTGYSTSLLGLHQEAIHEFSEHYNCCWAPSRRNHFFNNLSHLERVAHRPENLLLFSNKLSDLERVSHRLENLIL
jgi:hypothetical protein